ncbi:hypothetical protein Q3G72_022128 [Acer saccharum]|nr:hypothetical protein Q3G72_022128 [Acer saccharum]
MEMEVAYLLPKKMNKFHCDASAQIINCCQKQIQLQCLKQQSNGSIPSTLSNCSSSSFTGNLDLCGGPLPPSIAVGAALRWRGVHLRFGGFVEGIGEGTGERKHWDELQGGA